MQESADAQGKQPAVQPLGIDALDCLQRLNWKQPALCGEADTAQSESENANELPQADA